MKKINGFTLIELMVAIMIFAVISVISYRTISSLVTTKQIVTASQDKWGSIAKGVAKIDSDWNRAIPLVVRDANGMVLPSILGKNTLNGPFDSQLEMTISGFLGNDVYGSTPPQRIGFRFDKGKLYLVTWPVLNRTTNTQPRLDLLIDNVEDFHVSFMYTDRNWYDTWPSESSSDITSLPPGFKIILHMNSGESIMRQWSL